MGPHTILEELDESELLIEAANDPKMFAGHWRVWAYMMAVLPFEGYQPLLLEEVGEGIGMNAHNVCKYVKYLVEKKLILRGSKRQRYATDSVPTGGRKVYTYRRPW